MDTDGESGGGDAGWVGMGRECEDAIDRYGGGDDHRRSRPVGDGEWGWGWLDGWMGMGMGMGMGKDGDGSSIFSITILSVSDIEIFKGFRPPVFRFEISFIAKLPSPSHHEYLRPHPHDQPNPITGPIPPISGGRCNLQTSSSGHPHPHPHPIRRLTGDRLIVDKGSMSANGQRQSSREPGPIIN